MLGRRIDALERRLGIKLMHRTTRHLTLTERGTVFLDHCRKITDELEQTEQMIRERTGHFIVSAPALSAENMPCLIPRYFPPPILT